MIYSENCEKKIKKDFCLYFEIFVYFFILKFMIIYYIKTSNL